MINIDIDREQVIKHLNHLPSLPEAVSALLGSFSDTEVDLEKIAELIARDQALSARVLRIANSSFYGLQCRLGSIQDALVVVGFRAVRSMVVAAGINATFRADACPGYDPAASLRHSVAVGIAARALATILPGHNPELAFTAGILHDIGKLVLASGFPAEYAKVLSYRREHDIFLVVAERDIIGMDHAEIGGMLAETWQFPSALREGIAQHHAPAAARGTSLANLVHVADAVVLGLGYCSSPGDVVMPVETSAWFRIGLDSEKLGRVLPQVAAGIDELCLALSG
jgi:putative nucleotidyltransferase with HDIG domain